MRSEMKLIIDFLLLKIRYFKTQYFDKVVFSVTVLYLLYQLYQFLSPYIIHIGVPFVILYLWNLYSQFRKSLNVPSKSNQVNRDSMPQIGAPLTDFSEDKLNLGSFADDLTNNIVMSGLPHPTNEYSKVIALDSGWGTGKTSFINMWMKKLVTDIEFVCLKYSAWEHDDSPDALVPIIHALLPRFPWWRIKTIKTYIYLRFLANPEYASICLSIVFGIVFFLLGVYFLKVDLNEFEVLLTAVSVVMVLVKVMTNRFCMNYFARQKHKVLFKKLINGIRGKHDYLLICIDELDRCRPTFAIETLEVVKHFFNIPNVVFVFSLDMNQLQKSIETIYGNINSMSYLQRFFDYRISLPKQDLESFLKDRLEKLDPPHTDYEKKQCECEIIWLSEIARLCSISLRTLNNICVVYTKFKVYARSNFDWTKRWKDAEQRNINDLDKDKYGEWYYFKTYLLFIAMKYFCPDEYLSFIQNGANFDDLEMSKYEMLWYDVFGVPSNGDKAVECRSCYTKNIVSLTPHGLLDPSSDELAFVSIIAYRLSLNKVRYRLLVGSEIDMDEYRNLLLPDFIDRIIEDALLESKHPRAN